MKGFNYKDFMNNVRQTREGISETDFIIDKLSSNEVIKAPAVRWSASLYDLAQNLIKTVTVDNSTTITSSGFSRVNLEDYDINPDCKIYEYVEVGSQIGFESSTRMTFFDHENKISLRDEDFVHIGIAYEENLNGYDYITYVILADATIDSLGQKTTQRMTSN